MQRTGLSLIPILLLLTVAVPAVAQGVRDRNETLLAATSPYEDLVDAALAGQVAAVTTALARADSQAAAVRTALPAAAAGHFDELLRTIRKAVSDNQFQVVAMRAVEVFRLLLDELGPGHLKIPQEVNLLDYAGFKLKVLASAAKPDWDAMRSTAQEASAWWRAVEPGVTDPTLRDAFATTVAGLSEATKSENPAMLRLAAQIDLDLVDLLEHHFERKAHPALRP